MSAPSTVALLRLLAARPIPPCPPALAGYWAATAPLREELPAPVFRAAASGLYADRLGFAFVAGYQAALSALFGSERHALASLCATEATGARPRDLQARLTPRGAGWSLSGNKLLTTCSPVASVLYVVATSGDGPDGKPALKVARVPAVAQGVRLAAPDAIPFVPEVPHAGVAFEGVLVAAEDVLEGDGYARYLKPFRTVEDLHVYAAVLGYLVSLARRFSWPRAALEELLGLLAAACALAELPPEAPETHVALAGFLAQARRLVAERAPDLGALEAEERARWERDQPLFQVAERVRAQRLERAWERLRAAPDPRAARE